MKSVLLSSLALALMLPGVHAQDSAPAAAKKSQMDIDHDALWAIYAAHPDGELRKTNPKEFFRLYDDQMRRFSTAAREYAAKYPKDPRRYNGLIQSSYTRPYFLTGFKPEFDATPRDTNVIADVPALRAFWEAQVKFLGEVIEAPEASLRQRAGAMNALMIDSRALTRLRGEVFDIESIGPIVERALAKAPADTMVPVIDQYLAALKREKRDAAASALEAKLKAYPQVAAAYADAAAKRAAAEAEKAKKLTALSGMKFTAADGREVDMAKLKGKVVLIDFWATWCGPCIAELPNIKKVYSAYHDKGFEIIGITLENPNARPTDTAEQTAKKLEAAKSKMLEFTAKNEMPWPQYFDGKWWKNDYAVQFDIDSIPAMFLLGKDGKLVTTEARGEKLEAEVKRLLAI